MIFVLLVYLAGLAVLGGSLGTLLGEVYGFLAIGLGLMVLALFWFGYEIRSKRF